jgi:transcriptional regulator with XRE-family HTH domain
MNMARPLNEKIAELPAARREKVEARAAELIAEEMSLRDLRRAMGKTQAKVAADLGVGQDSVARYEQRTDMLISTLSEFIHKVGGTLELTARFPNRIPVKIKGFGEISSRSDTHGMPIRSRKSLEDRHRDPADGRVGEIRAKRKDTAVGTLRKESGVDGVRGVRSDARLGDIREHREPKLRKRAKSTA